MHRLVLAAALFAASASASAAAAQPAPPPGGPGAPGLFLSPAGEPFRTQPGGPSGREQWFAGADANGDGALTRAEFAADADRFFTRLDTDRDSRLSDREIGVWESEVVPEILPRGPGRPSDAGEGAPAVPGPPGGEGLHAGQAGGGRGQPPGGGRGGEGVGPQGQGRKGRAAPYDAARQGAAPYGLLADPHPLRSADTDFDMRVSAQEWAAATARRFGLLDQDHDGRLTLAELPRPAPGGAPGRGKGRRPPGP